MRYLIITFVLLLSSCAIGIDAAREKSSNFDRQKTAIEGRAKAGELTWVSAITQERELDKQFASQATTVFNVNLSGYSYGHSWKYDIDDEEYYAYCLALAEKLDAKEIRYSDFDYLRIQKLNELNKSRSQVQSSEESARAASAAAARPKNCTSSSDMTGNIVTTCH